MRYVVTIKYYRFLFDNVDEALAFAGQAKLHYKKDRTDSPKDPEVYITLITDEDEKAEESEKEDE